MNYVVFFLDGGKGEFFDTYDAAKARFDAAALTYDCKLYVLVETTK